MKLEVEIIERKEQLDDLIPFSCGKMHYGELRNCLLCMDISDFIPQDAFYLKLICEEKNPLRVLYGDQ